MQSLEIIYPDDWHCHLRDGETLAMTVPNAAQQFKRVIAMPNLIPPVATIEQAHAYQKRIQHFIPAGKNLIPLLTLYLTDLITPSLIKEAHESKIIFGVKLYPKGVTTNSQAGVTQLRALYPTFEAMVQAGLPLLIHGESERENVDIFDREKFFIEEHLFPLTKHFPTLKIVFEHITTKEAVDFVKESSATIAATITPHHLLLNRNALFSQGLRPHHYCLPILKRQHHQHALIDAAISGNPRFFIGTDSAPHPQGKKEAACGCAGIYHTHALEIYAHIFEEKGALDKLEGFTSRFGTQFYGLPLNTEKCRLEKKSFQVPTSIALNLENFIPFQAGETLYWQRLA